MKSTNTILTAITTGLLLSACITTVNAKPQNAVADTLSNVAKQEIEQSISSMLNGKPVTISHNAFSESNRLIIERAQRLGPNGNPIQGRVLELPEVFLLKTKGQHCLLEYEATGEMHMLTHVLCKNLNH